MLIDWFTVGAQALNFLVLVWLLKRFLYKPILNAIDAREKLIAAKLADADTKVAEAKKERDAFEHKNAAFDKQRATLMSKATDDATAERKKLLHEARQAADTLSAKRHESLRSDAESLNQALRSRAQQEVFAIARRALTDLAGASLEDRMVEVFIHRLQTMDGKTKETLAAAIRSASAPALVRSTFKLPERQRAAIQASLDETFSTQIQIQFETAPDLVGGVELTATGQKLAWSITDYLASLEEGVKDLLNDHDNPQSKSAPKPAAKSLAGAKVAKKTRRRSPSRAKQPKPKVAHP